MSTTSTTTTKWSVDSMHSEIGFKVKHMMITNVNGSFGTYTITSETNGEDLTNANIQFTAKVDSINTGVADRDAHLKSDDFFNAETYPEITFKSTSLTKVDGEQYELIGDLTIRDITRTEKFNVEYSGLVVDPYGQVKTGFVVEGKIKRSDFNLKWSAITEAGSIVVSDDIKIHAEVQMIKHA
ncbi:MAG: YceI family protein [bacterium]|nr:YceI family protein [bacterium]